MKNLLANHPKGTDTKSNWAAVIWGWLCHVVIGGGLVPYVGDITITPSWDGSPKPPEMPVWNRGVTVLSLDLHRTGLAGLRHKCQGEIECRIIYTWGAYVWEQQYLIRDLSEMESLAPRDTYTRLVHSVSVASRFSPTLSKITPFGPGLKGKCVRLICLIWYQRWWHELGEDPTQFRSLQQKHLSSMCKCWTDRRQNFFF